MSSPFQELDLRAKLFLWSLAILFGGIVLYANKERVAVEVDSIAQELNLEEAFPEIENPLDTFLEADEDGDGLKNSLEILLGGNIAEEDTDEDGFTDYEEFLGGYDLTSARDEAYSIEELEEFFAAFDAEFGQFINIRGFYYSSRADALLENGQEGEAQVFYDLLETQPILTE